MPLEISDSKLAQWCPEEMESIVRSGSAPEVVCEAVDGLRDVRGITISTVRARTTKSITIDIYISTIKGFPSRQFVNK